MNIFVGEINFIKEVPHIKRLLSGCSSELITDNGEIGPRSRPCPGQPEAYGFGHTARDSFFFGLSLFSSMQKKQILQNKKIRSSKIEKVCLKDRHTV